jgi:hypothetical protein
MVTSGGVDEEVGLDRERKVLVRRNRPVARDQAASSHEGRASRHSGCDRLEGCFAVPVMYSSIGNHSSFQSLTLGRKGLADATITFEGAGAGVPARSVASNIWSSLPSIGARPTNSTRTRALPLL